MNGEYPLRPKGAGQANVAFVLSLFSIGCGSCLGLLGGILGVLAIVFAVLAKQKSGAWCWQSALGLGLGVLGVLFGTFTAVLIIVSFVRKDMDSIYGYFMNLREGFSK